MLELWTEAVRSIEPKVKPAHRDLWLRPIECVAIDGGEVDDGVSFDGGGPGRIGGGQDAIRSALIRSGERTSR